MRLIIISRATATGKTSISKEIAGRLGYPLYGKDAIKEKFYDKQTLKDHGYFWYEKQAKDVFFKDIERAIAQNQSIIVENNFMNNDKQRLRALLTKDVEVVEIYCRARGFTRLRRFVARGEARPRGGVHHDRQWYPTVFIGCLLGCIGIKWPYGPVKASNKIFDLDTTDFSKVRREEVVKFIKSD